MLTGRAPAPRDREGRIFLDRDSAVFRAIRFFPFPIVYAVGGHDGANHLSAVEMLDVENQCWRPCRPMTTPRSYFGAAALHSRLYLFGGQNLEYRALLESECFDCLRGAWMPGPNLNVPRRNCASAILNGQVYAIGGFDGSKIISSVEAFDPRMKNWMTVEPMSGPRSGAAAAVVGEKLYVCGGTSGSRL